MLWLICIRIVLWTSVIHVGRTPEEAGLDPEKGSRQTSNVNLAALSNFQDSDVKFDIVWMGGRIKINRAAVSLFFTATGVLLSFFFLPFFFFLYFLILYLLSLIFKDLLQFGSRAAFSLPVIEQQMLGNEQFGQIFFFQCPRLLLLDKYYPLLYKTFFHMVFSIKKSGKRKCEKYGRMRYISLASTKINANLLRAQACNILQTR